MKAVCTHASLKFSFFFFFKKIFLVTNKLHIAGTNVLACRYASVMSFYPRSVAPLSHQVDSQQLHLGWKVGRCLLHPKGPFSFFKMAEHRQASVHFILFVFKGD